MAVDTSHLVAIQQRLSNERMRLEKTTGKEAVARRVTVQGIERELEGEFKFLGINPTIDDEQMTDDGLLTALGL
jgi:hypothetical protein